MARDDKTSIYAHGAAPNTRVAISQKNRVFSKPFGTDPSFKQIGVLATFDYSESRAIDPVRGVGYGDNIQELVPGVTEPMSVTLNRTLLYTSSIMQEVGYKGGVDGLVRSLRHHRWPFDLKSELVFSELITQDYTAQRGVKPVGGGADDPVETQYGLNQALVTYFWACWLNSVSASFPSDSAIVIEDASVTCTDVTDGYRPTGVVGDYGPTLDSGNNPFAPVPGLGSLIFR
jgi:hypothetical protein